MANKQLMLPANRAFNSNGLAISGAQAKLYTTGTSTPANFYADSGLITSLGSTLTANGAGRFPTAYQDQTVPFRFKVLDSDGAVLDDIDPFYFGQTVISLNSNYITPLHFGAVADCTAVGTGTDNLAAFNAAIAAAGLHGTVYIPAGHYRLSGPLTLTNGIKLTGEGHSENPGTIGGTTYSLPLNYQGSVLVFDQNQPGLKLFDFTDNAANATAYEFQGARFAVLEDFMLYGGGGTTVTAHGVDLKTVARARNLRIANFAGNGLNIVANTTGSSTYGNADISRFDAVLSRSNGCHGVFISGNDANAMSFTGCSSMQNGGVGYLDKTTVGNNVFVGCHASTNNQSYGASSTARTQVTADWAGLSDQMAGSYVMTVGTENSYIGCYTESGTGTKAELLAPAQVIGGFLSETGSQTANFTALYMNGTNNGVLGNVAALIPATANLGLTGNLSITRAGNNVATLNLSPGGTQVYSQVALKGNGGSAVLGLDILAGSGVGYLSADTLILRNAAQATTFGTWSATGLNMGASSVLSFSGTTILNSSGVLQAAGVPVFTGDVTSAGGALALTIGANAVTYAKFQQVAASSLVGNATGSLANAAGITLAGGLTFSGTTLTAAGALTPTSVASTGAITSSSASAGVGYAAGAGGTAAQSASKSTTVSGTNKMCVDITLNGAALGASTTVSFTFTNTVIAATDNLIINHISVGTFGSYTFNGRCTGGSATIDVRNVSLGSLSEAIVIRVTVLKGANT